MNRTTQLLVTLIGAILIGVAAHGQTTFTGGDAPVTIKRNGATGNNDAALFIDGNNNRQINFVEGTTRRGGIGHNNTGSGSLNFFANQGGINDADISISGGYDRQIGFGTASPNSQFNYHFADGQGSGDVLIGDNPGTLSFVPRLVISKDGLSGTPQPMLILQGNGDRLINFHEDDTRRGGIGHNAAADAIVIYAQGAGVGGPDISINKFREVGIGTIDPQADFHIANGDALIGGSNGSTGRLVVSQNGISNSDGILVLEGDTNKVITFEEDGTRRGGIGNSHSGVGSIVMFGQGGGVGDPAISVLANTQHVQLGHVPADDSLDSVLVIDGSGTVHARDAGTIGSAGGGDDGDWVVNGNEIYTALPGNVGIGTSTPGASLEVSSPTNFKTLILSGAAAPGILFQASAVNGTIRNWQIATNPFGLGGISFVRSPTPGTAPNIAAFAIDSRGYVSFGNVAPSRTLHVAGGTNPLANNNGADITLEAQDAGEPGPAHGGDIILLPGSAASGGGNDGNVGIGTSSPFAKLHIDGSAAKLKVSDSANYGGEVVVYTANGTPNIDLVSHGGTASGGIAFQDGAKNQEWAIKTNAIVGTGLEFIDGNSTVVMNLAHGGNVGIGTTSPGAKLQVAGQVKITGGDPGDGKVLTSDADGLATWADAAGGGGGDDGDWVVNGNEIYTALPGNVGIGTSAPGAALDVSSPTNFKTLILRGATAPGILFQANAANATIRNWHIATNPFGLGGISFVRSPSPGTAPNIAAFAIDSRGYVAFGNVVPSRTLHVAGGTNPLANNNGADITLEAQDAGEPGPAHGGDIILLPGSAASGGGNDGNVGIGTTAPGAKLEVAGQMKITGGSPGAGKVLTSDASGLASWEAATGGADGDWVVNGNEIYTALPGNVGIGTSAPGAALDVSSPTNFKTLILRGATAPGILFQANAANATIRNWHIATNPFGLGGISFVRSPSPGTAPNIAAFAIDSRGYVAFGNVVPSRTLHVAGGTNPLANNNGADITLEAQDAGEPGPAHGGDIILLPGSAASGGGSNGNVGIGTTAPGAKLEVAGQVKITGGSPGAGKVLTSDAAGLATWESPGAGSQGPQGKQGPAGADGAQGPAGPVGSEFWDTNVDGDLYSTAGAKVGIGTTEPGAGNPYGYSAPILEVNGTDPSLRLKNGSNYASIGLGTEMLQIGTNGDTTQLTIRHNGSIGIGTGEPASVPGFPKTLHIRNTVGPWGDVSIRLENDLGNNLEIGMSGNEIQFYFNSTKVMSIDESGNLSVKGTVTGNAF